MAETISQYFAGGYQSAIDMTHAAQRATDESSLLSSRAQEAQIAAAEQKQAYQTKMEGRASLAQISKANADIDASTQQGQRTILQKGLEANKDKPEVAEWYRNQLKSSILDEAETNKAQAASSEAIATVQYDAVAAALVNKDPESWDLAIKNATGPAKDILQKVKTMHLSPAYQGLKPEDREVADKKILAQIAPEKAAAAILRVQSDKAYRDQMIQLRQDAEDRRKQEDIQKSAIKQQGDSMKEDLLELRKTQAISGLERTLSNIPPTIKNPESSWYNTEPDNIPNPEYTRLSAKLDKLYGVEIPKADPSSKTTLSPADQEALDWAKANPNDPASKEILKHLGQ